MFGFGSHVVVSVGCCGQVHEATRDIHVSECCRVIHYDSLAPPRRQIGHIANYIDQDIYTDYPIFHYSYPLPVQQEMNDGS